MREYDVSGQQTQDPLGFNGSNRGYGFASAIDDVAGTFLFGDPDASSNIWAELSGYNSQQREFQQQEYLLEKEQNWNSEGARMERMKAAGINPLTAAAGIAGSQGSATAPAVSNATGSPSAAVGSAASMLNSVGSSRQAFAEASFKGATEEPTVQNIIADTEEKATQAGYNKEQAQNLAISNLFLSREKALGLIALRKNLDLMDSQRDLYIAQKEHFGSLIKEVDEHIEVMKAERNLIGTQEAVEKKRGLLLDQQTFELKWQNDIRTMFKIDPTQPIENNTFLLWLQKSPLYDSSLDFIQDINYKRYTGQYKSQSEQSWLSRPTNQYEAAANLGRAYMPKLRELISKVKPSELLEKVNTDKEASAELDDLFNDAKDELKVSMNDAKRLYREVRFSGAADSYKAECKQKYENLKSEYESFTREKFLDILLEQDLNQLSESPFNH
ncbi:MAG: hypothetical protein J6S67_20450 [Methanobrevibacter sp.]|nr:hypothetical protein [Methanobrevibacter sp.]